jgi:DNA-directed RNA polymerase specialized sigma24 family protein
VSAANGMDVSARRRSESDTDLLVRVRSNDPRALREFVSRFDAILLYQARRMGVSEGERRTVVIEFLDDILVKLARSAAPKDLAPFVITSFRNFVTDMHRQASIREQRNESVEDVSGLERVIRAGCSEFMLRAAQAPSVDDTDPPLAAMEMLDVVFESCSDEEKTLLIWSAHRVPLRDCAVWMGISYSAMKQRMYRLRARLARDCLGRLRDLPAPDRIALTRILNRAGIQTNGDQTRGSAA